MEKTFLEKRIEEKAKGRLKTEMVEASNLLYNNRILNKVAVNNKRVFYIDENSWQEPEMKEALDKRLAELIKEETDEVLSKLQNISYLFNQVD